MKVKLISDVHVEFHVDRGRKWASSIPNDCDVLVIAGDFGTKQTWRTAMDVISDRFERIVYVLGNHEYYNSSFDAVHDDVDRFCAMRKNVTWLNNGVVTIGDVRFVGTTMWFSLPNDNYVRSHMRNFTDLRHIQGSMRIFDENEHAQRFLRETVRQDDIVVTHHLPSQVSVSPRFVGSQLNCFFVCDMEDVIIETKPKLWLHGHTHDSQDAVVGSTRIVCNPYGYEGGETNFRFDDDLTLEV